MTGSLRITWINPGRIECREGRFTSARACVRLRCIGPGLELVKSEHDVQTVSLFDWHEWANQPGFYDRDVFVVGKAFLDVSPVVHQIHATGRKVVVDVCDNVFDPPEDGLRHVYDAILPLADGVVASSDTLRTAIAGRVAPPVPVVAIPDFVEGERLKPVFAPSQALKLLWFGYPNNLPLVYSSLPAFAALGRQYPVELSLVTAWESHARCAFENPPVGLTIRLVEWSAEAMKEELARCDIVVIPSDDSPARVTKSANRVITSLWAGRYVVASPLPSYVEFSPFAGIGRNLTASINWALENPSAAAERIAAGQKFIAYAYAGERIGSAWESFLRRLLG